jgi:hypothetical protein
MNEDVLYFMLSQGRFLFFSSFWQGPGSLTPALCLCINVGASRVTPFVYLRG